MIHSILKDAIEAEFAQALESAELCRDALLVRWRNGLVIELRFANAREYAIGWQWGDAQLRIDTAPLHPHLETFPHHLHDGDGQLRADRVTRPGDSPWDNVRVLVATLLEDPLLGEPGELPAGLTNVKGMVVS